VEEMAASSNNIGGGDGRLLKRVGVTGYGALKESSRRLFRYIRQVASAGGPVEFFDDMLTVVGSRSRVVIPGLRELHALGLIDWQRFPKRHVIGATGDDRQRRCAGAADADDDTSA
jgi:hypothetical protein